MGRRKMMRRNMDLSVGVIFFLYDGSGVGGGGTNFTMG
jgi:hypothetical protein